MNDRNRYRLRLVVGALVLWLLCASALIAAAIVTCG